MFITVDTLRQAYGELGFIQDADDPEVFRHPDGRGMLHHAIGGEVDTGLVLEDLKNSFPELEEQMKGALTQLLLQEQA